MHIAIHIDQMLDILNLAIPAVTLLASFNQAGHQLPSSRILCLHNMVAIDELDDEDEYLSSSHHLSIVAIITFLPLISLGTLTIQGTEKLLTFITSNVIIFILLTLV